MHATVLARTAFSFAAATMFAGACLVGAVAPAAASTSTAATKVVRYGDLDLSRPQGRAALDARIKAAAKFVCTDGGSDLKSRMAQSSCVRTAIAAARS